METFKILWSSNSWRRSICIILIPIRHNCRWSFKQKYCFLRSFCDVYCERVLRHNGLLTLLWCRVLWRSKDSPAPIKLSFIRWLFDNKIYLMVEQKIICFTDICLIYSTLSWGRSYVIKMKDNEKKATWCTWCDTWPLRIWREKLVKKFAFRIFLKVRVWNTVVCIWNYCAKNEHWRCRESQRRCQGLLW